MNFGLDSLFFRGSFLWNTLDDSIKGGKTLACFQKKICKWLALRATAIFVDSLLYIHAYNVLVFLILCRFMHLIFRFLIVGLN